MSVSPYIRDGVKFYNVGVDAYMAKSYDQCEKPLLKAVGLFLHETDHDRLNACMDLLVQSYTKQKKYKEATMMLTRQVSLFKKMKFNRKSCQEWCMSWRSKLRFNFEAKDLNNELPRSANTEKDNHVLSNKNTNIGQQSNSENHVNNQIYENKQVSHNQIVNGDQAMTGAHIKNKENIESQHLIQQSDPELELNGLFKIIRKYCKYKCLTKRHDSMQIFSLKDVIMKEEKKFPKEKLFCTSDDLEAVNTLLELELISLEDIEIEYHASNFFSGERRHILKQLLANCSNETIFPIRKSVYEIEYTFSKRAIMKDYIKSLNLQQISQRLINFRKPTAQDTWIKSYLEGEIALNYLTRSFVIYNRYISEHHSRYNNIHLDTNGKPITKSKYLALLIQYIEEDLQSNLNSLNSNTYKEIMLNFKYAITSVESAFTRNQNFPIWRFIRDIHLFNQYFFTLYYILDHFRQIDLQSRTMNILRKLNQHDEIKLLQIEIENCYLHFKIGNLKNTRRVILSLQKRYFWGKLNNHAKYPKHLIYLFRLLYIFIIDRDVEALENCVKELESISKEKKVLLQSAHIYSLAKYFIAELILTSNVSSQLHHALDSALSSLMYRSRATSGHIDINQLALKPLSDNNGLLTNNMDYHLISQSLLQVSRIYSIFGQRHRLEHHLHQGLILSLQTLSYSYLIEFMSEIVEFCKLVRTFDRASIFLEMIGQFVQGFYSHAITGTYKQEEDIISYKQKALYHIQFADYFHELGLVDASINQQITKHIESGKHALHSMYSIDKSLSNSFCNSYNHCALQTLTENPILPTMKNMEEVSNIYIIQVELYIRYINLSIRNDDEHCNTWPTYYLMDSARSKIVLAIHYIQNQRLEDAVSQLLENKKTISLDIPRISWKTLGFLSMILDHSEAYLYPGIAQGLQLRHQKLIDLKAKKKEIEKRKQMEEGAISDITKFIQEVTFDENRYDSQMPIFSNPIHESMGIYEHIVELLPKNFIVCSLCLTSNYQTLIAERVCSSEKNAIQQYRIPMVTDKSSIDCQFMSIVNRAYMKQEIESSKYSFMIKKSKDICEDRVHILYVIMMELNSILKQSGSWMENIDKYTATDEKKFEWWKAMMLLDKRMQNLIALTENMLLPKSVKQSIFSKVGIENAHTVLILDRMLCQLPWEYISILRNESCSRVPSFVFLCAALKEHYSEHLPKDEVNMENVSYILNPDGDLTSTEERFQEFINNDVLSDYCSQWKGIVGRPPLSSEFDSITTNDVFLYMGHGAGEQYFSSDIIRNMRSKQLKLVLLMGCSSGKLKFCGEFEPDGSVLNYISNGIPSMIVANLWDVTARECDRFTFELLRRLLSRDHDKKYISRVVSESRESCMLKYLMGAAPICYGLPLYVKSIDKMDLNTSTLEENILQSCDTMDLNISNLSNLSLEEKFI